MVRRNWMLITVGAQRVKRWVGGGKRGIITAIRKSEYPVKSSHWLCQVGHMSGSG